MLSDVRLKNHGSEMIEVVDNGCGVDEPNFRALSMSQLIFEARKLGWPSTNILE